MLGTEQGSGGRGVKPADASLGGEPGVLRPSPSSLRNKQFADISTFPLMLLAR